MGLNDESAYPKKCCVSTRANKIGHIIVGKALEFELDEAAKLGYSLASRLQLNRH
jgi:hypothetical protein